MKRALIFIIFVFGSGGFMVQKVNAVPVASSPACEINAEVLDIEKIKTATGAINAEPREIEYYSVKIKISQCATYKHEGDRACDELYPVNSEQDTVLWPEEYNKQSMIKGNKIKAKIERRGDERFHGIFLSDVQIDENK